MNSISSNDRGNQSDQSSDGSGGGKRTAGVLPVVREQIGLSDLKHEVAAAGQEQGKGIVGCYLAGILADVVVQAERDHTTRRYVTTITSDTILQGVPNTATRATIFHVMARITTNELFAEKQDNKKVVPTETIVRCADYVANDFCGYARRWANFSGDFSVFDYSMITARIAQSLAYYANTGVLRGIDMRGGSRPLITAMGMQTPPITASKAHLFMPRCADSITSPNVFCAIMNAATWGGTTIITDILNVDANNNAIIPDCNGMDLAEGCYHALRLIGSNYARSNAMDIFSYAVTRGVHSAVTVVSHTDEGGIFRDVLRRSGFTQSFGGLNTGMRDYVGLPIPEVFTRRGVTKLIDSIALATAGIVAACDPLTQIEGRYYPTVISSEVSATCYSGNDSASTDADRANLIKQLISAGCTMAPIYIRALLTVFSGTGDSGRALTHLCGSFSAMHSYRGEHIKHKSIAPFFWIEPTGVCYLPRSEFLAVAEGFGQLTEPRVATRIPLCERAAIIGEIEGLTGIGMSWRTARTNGATIHMSLSRDGSLENAVLRQCDPWSFAFQGGNEANMLQRMEAGLSLRDMMWTRGFSCLPSAAETIYTGKDIALLCKQHTFNDSTFEVTPVSMFRGEEFCEGEITLRCCRPFCIKPAEHSVDYSPCVRARTVASKALSVARRGRGVMLTSDLLRLKASGPNCTIGLPSRTIFTTSEEAYEREMHLKAAKSEGDIISSVGLPAATGHQSLNTQKGNQVSVMMAAAPVVGPRTGLIEGIEHGAAHTTPTMEIAPASGLIAMRARNAAIYGNTELFSNIAGRAPATTETAPAPASCEGAEAS